MTPNMINNIRSLKNLFFKFISVRFTGLLTSVITHVMHELVLNGLTIKVTRSKVVIIDVFDDVSDEEAEKILCYLYTEGFVKNQTVICEVITGEDLE
jgi:hypothetical protein